MLVNGDGVVGSGRSDGVVVVKERGESRRHDGVLDGGAGCGERSAGRSKQILWSEHGSRGRE